MSRIFWDTMLFVYLLDEHPEYFNKSRDLLERSFERGDLLFTSHLALGELMAGLTVSPKPHVRATVRETLTEMGFHFLPFDDGSVGPFSNLRAKQKLRIADSIHLACAASHGIDLFLTGDKDLFKVHVPGVQFIADFNAAIY
ncbi:MAG: PIN domain-containing protein [Terracidiphilus sp.]|jgi:predicted nucleic acid-binding protein